MIKDGKKVCVDKCDDGYFGNAKTKECEKCDETCEKCIGTADSCVYPCKKGYVYKNTKCVKECPEGWFSYGITD